MKVRELIELLNDLDTEATVVIAIQPGWPVEYQLAGVAVREDCGDDAGQIRTGLGQAPNDVILVVGEQVGYGEREAWRAAARAHRLR